MKKLLPLFLFLLSGEAFSQAKYKIVVFTDDEAYSRAEEFKAYLLTKPPFSKMGDKLDLGIVRLTKEEMACGNTMPDAPRVVTCDFNKLADKQAIYRGNLALAFTSSGSGGAGGSIPVASKDFPIQTMFHEMLHTFGLADEYDYSESEKGVYCVSPTNSLNIVYFKDRPPYTNDLAARNMHRTQIPWLGSIPQVKTITTGSELGSSLAPQPKGGQTMGLYRGGSCNSTSLPGWRPYLDSIMRNYYDDTIYPIYEEIIVKNIEYSLGKKLDLPPPPFKCFEDDFNLQRFEKLRNEFETIKFHTNKKGP